MHLQDESQRLRDATQFLDEENRSKTENIFVRSISLACFALCSTLHSTRLVVWLRVRCARRTSTSSRRSSRTARRTSRSCSRSSSRCAARST